MRIYKETGDFFWRMRDVPSYGCKICADILITVPGNHLVNKHSFSWVPQNGYIYFKPRVLR